MSSDLARKVCERYRLADLLDRPDVSDRAWDAPEISCWQ